jgi:hypothetical protein
VFGVDGRGVMKRESPAGRVAGGALLKAMVRSFYSDPGLRSESASSLTRVTSCLSES